MSFVGANSFAKDRNAVPRAFTGQTFGLLGE
jgi:hypothetical protein